MKNPCQENWEGMTPSESGRHCDKCKTEVIDFTQLTNSEIIHYFKSSKQREGCGRFLKSQIDTIQIPVDEEIFFQHSNYFQKFLFVFLLCFGPEIFNIEFVFGQELDSNTINIEQTADTTSVSASNDT